jgi:macrolide transport system ATP-binding/permease protein
MVSHDRALREWFAGCARQSREAARGQVAPGHHGIQAGSLAVGRWIRYSMDNGVLAPA